MKKLLFLLFVLTACLAAACSDDDLATSASDQPVPSADTLHLGLILGGNSSPTYQLKLYNRCGSELRLSSITLRDAATSGFRMNVDGMNGTSFTNSDLLRIARGDSLFIFIEATFTDAAERSYHTDYVDIVCNGRLQTVVLDAETVVVDVLHAPVISADTTWPKGTCVQIYDSLVVAQGVTLTLEDSVTVYLHDKTDIVVHGTLLAYGKLGKPVVLRGDRTDRMFTNLYYDGLPAQWGNLYIDSTAQHCRFEYAEIRGMNQGIFIDSTEVTFSNCRLRNSSANLLTCHMTSLSLRNCELANASNSLLDVYGGSYSITHCTLANYNFWKATSVPAVHLCNIDTAAARYTPLYKCTFLNTLIWGRWRETEVHPDYFRVAVGQDTGGTVQYADSVFVYRFDHCLLKANGFDDDDFIENVWNEDPQYRLIDHSNYAYDFHLLDDSPAREAGSAEGRTLCPTDLDGVARPNLPSIGCYQWVSE